MISRNAPPPPGTSKAEPTSPLPATPTSSKHDSVGAPSAGAAPSAATSPLPAVPAGEANSPIHLTNLTTGLLWKEGDAMSVSTEPVTLGRDSLGLLHLMSCCDHASVPTVTGPGGPWVLAVTHETGEKRHWVFEIANEGGPVRGALTVRFANPQSRVLWIVDQATNVDLRNGGADAIVQTAWQDSKANDDAGQIELEPFEDPTRNVGVAFTLAGSGTATDIDPERGATETAEAEVGGSSLIINTFWRPGQDGPMAAEFLDDSGRRAVESWLILAIELRARPVA